jgi:hypothetical protein
MHLHIGCVQSSEAAPVRCRMRILTPKFRSLCTLYTHATRLRCAWFRAPQALKFCAKMTRSHTRSKALHSRVTAKGFSANIFTKPQRDPWPTKHAYEGRVSTDPPTTTQYFTAYVQNCMHTHKLSYLYMHERVYPHTHAQGAARHPYRVGLLAFVCVKSFVCGCVSQYIFAHARAGSGASSLSHWVTCVHVRTVFCVCVCVCVCESQCISARARAGAGASSLSRSCPRHVARRRTLSRSRNLPCASDQSR